MHKITYSASLFAGSKKFQFQNDRASQDLQTIDHQEIHKQQPKPDLHVAAILNCPN